MTRIVRIALVVAVVLSCIQITNVVTAGEKEKLVPLSLTGAVSSEQQERTNKDGTVKNVAVYFLQTENEKIQLPPPAGCKIDNDPSLNLASHVGSRVTISAKGLIRTAESGAKTTVVRHIAKIKKVDSAEA
jgi:hypothetical protein